MTARFSFIYNTSVSEHVVRLPKRRSYSLRREGSSGQVNEYSAPEGPDSRLVWRNTVMYANGIWCVQYPPSSHLNYTSGGTKAGEPSLPGRIKIVMAYLRIILRDEFQTIDNSPLAQLQSDIKPTQPNPPQRIKIIIACLLTFLRGVTHTYRQLVYLAWPRNNPLRSFTSTLNLFNQSHHSFYHGCFLCAILMYWKQ